MAISGAFVVIATAAACGETVTIDQPKDTGDGSTSSDGSTAADGSTPGVDGGGTVDTGTSGGDAAQDAATCGECKPDFCGCGECKRDQIVCTKNPVACPLGCATSCDSSNVKCGCSSDRCVSVTPAPEKIPCYTTLDCPPTQCCKKDVNERSGVCVAGTGC